MAVENPLAVANPLEEWAFRRTDLPGFQGMPADKLINCAAENGAIVAELASLNQALASDCGVVTGQVDFDRLSLRQALLMSELSVIKSPEALLQRAIRIMEALLAERERTLQLFINLEDIRPNGPSVLERILLKWQDVVEAKAILRNITSLVPIHVSQIPDEDPQEDSQEHC